MTFLGNPVTFTGKPVTASRRLAHDFSLTATDLSKKTPGWLCWQKKKFSIIHPIDTGMLDSGLVFNQKNSLTWTIPLLSQFQLICLLHKASVALLKALKCCYAIWLLQPFFRCATLSSSVDGAFYSPQFSFWMRTTLWPMPICRQYQHWTWYDAAIKRKNL